jgi:hypothetical protein
MVNTGLGDGVEGVEAVALRLDVPRPATQRAGLPAQVNVTPLGEQPGPSRFHS